MQSRISGCCGRSNDEGHLIEKLVLNKDFSEVKYLAPWVFWKRAFQVESTAQRRNVYRCQVWGGDRILMFSVPSSHWRALHTGRQDVCCVEDHILRRLSRRKKANQYPNASGQVSYNNGLDQRGHSGRSENWFHLDMFEDKTNSEYPEGIASL